MRKITKIINKRRKNYKPVTGVVDTHGRKALISTEHIKAYEAAVEREKPIKKKMKLRHEIVALLVEDALTNTSGDDFNLYFF